MATSQILFFLPALIAGLAFLGIISIFHRKSRFTLASMSVVLAAISIISAYLLSASVNTTLLEVLHVYPFSMLMLSFFSAALILILVLFYDDKAEFNALALLLSFSAVGIFIIAMANSLISILLASELVAVPTILMVALNGFHRTEAAAKLFLLSAISIAVMSFAIALIFPYDATFSLALASASLHISGNYLVLLSMALFIAAFAVEAAFFPFNLWVSDVYSGSPGYVTAFIAGINKKVAFVATLEVLFIVFAAYHSQISYIFEILAIFTMFFGNLVAMAQRNIKKMFAYSSISQAGYIAVGIAAVSALGITAVIFQIVAHAFMIIGAFAIVFWLEEKGIISLDDYRGLGSRNGLAAIALTLFMLSMAGVPPLMGFVGKFLLFSSAIYSGLLALALIGVLNSFLSIYYYGRLISYIYEDRRGKPLLLQWQVKAVVLISLAVILIFGIYPEPLISGATIAAKSLINFVL
ncbi:NADH-quinone oxidoreductase subunit N [Candidatus Marsarchaeota archaeon]|nr:NADH-quinone oxidoreductase subunit N [Candidatus Marsarchaeota archaeon]